MRARDKVIVIALLVPLFLAGIVAGKHHRTKQEAERNNVVFESSDGRWMDFTDNLKGRHFDSVLWTFEAYRFLENQPDVTLVRITERQEGAKDLVEWKVPHGLPSGLARAYLQPITPAQHEEIAKRAKATMEYWERK